MLDSLAAFPLTHNKEEDHLLLPSSESVLVIFAVNSVKLTIIKSRAQVVQISLSNLDSPYRASVFDRRSLYVSQLSNTVVQD